MNKHLRAKSVIPVIYTDKSGVKNRSIQFLPEDVGMYKKGWYFVDETGCYGNESPCETAEKALLLLEANERCLSGLL